MFYSEGYCLFAQVLDRGGSVSRLEVCEESAGAHLPEDVLESGLCRPPSASSPTSASASFQASASASAAAINNNPEECEYVGTTGAVHDPHGTCTAADIEAANE